MARSQILIVALLGLLCLAAAGGDNKYGYGAEVGHYKEEIRHIGHKLRKHGRKHRRHHRKCRRGHRYHKLRKHCVKIHHRRYAKVEEEVEHRPRHHDKYEREEREYGYGHEDKYEREHRPRHHDKYEREEREYGYGHEKKYEAPKYEGEVELIENVYAKLPGYAEAAEWFNTYGRDSYVEKYGEDKYNLL